MCLVRGMDWSKRPGVSEIYISSNDYNDQSLVDFNNFIVVHGAGSFGHFQASKSWVHKGRTADFFYMLLFGAIVLTGIVLIGVMTPFVSESFAEIFFLSNSLTFMMVYVWSKQNPFIHMSFLGLFTFTAAYLP